MFQPFILVMQIASLLAIGFATRARPMHESGFTLNDLLCVPAGLLGTFIGLALYQGISTRQFAIVLNLLLIAARLSFLV